MAQEVTASSPPALAPQLAPLPEQLTESERRIAFRMEMVRTENGTETKRLFVPPSETERCELESVKAALEPRLVPARPEQIVKALAKMAVLFKPERSDAEWQVLYDAYCADLVEFSAAHIGQALVEHRRTQKWFPKISEIRGRCLELRELDNIRLRRIKTLLTGDDGVQAWKAGAREDRVSSAPLPTVAEILARHRVTPEQPQ